MNIAIEVVRFTILHKPKKFFVVVFQFNFELSFFKWVFQTTQFFKKPVLYSNGFHDTFGHPRLV